MTERRTKRRYAHELYPHAAEGDIRPLDVEVPYRIARAVGFDVQGTGWLNDDVDPKLSVDRTMHIHNLRNCRQRPRQRSYPKQAWFRHWVNAA